jgi:hypothetical protein
LSLVSANEPEPNRLRIAEPFDIAGAKERLAAGSGGYEVVHRSEGLEIGVYVLVLSTASSATSSSACS